MSCHGDPMYDRMMAGMAQNMGGPGGSDSAAFIQDSFTEQKKKDYLHSMSGQIELLHKQKETLGAMGERDEPAEGERGASRAFLPRGDAEADELYAQAFRRHQQLGERLFA